MFGAICHVETWIKYRRQLLAGWMNDANRLAKESIRKEKHRKTQRGHWI